MPRTHGYAPKGKRCFGTHDWQARGRINVIGALLGAALLTTGLFTCNINSDVFHGWLVESLIPNLPPGSVLVMDNATFHKRNDSKNAISQAGIRGPEYAGRTYPGISPVIQPRSQPD